MKYKIKILIITIVSVASLLISSSTYAQDFSPLSKLAQDYILRLNLDQNTNSVIPIKDTVIVNPEAVTQNAVAESINTISKTVEEVTKIQDKTILEIKAIIKEGIDNSIIDIKKKQVDKSAFELQKVIDTERNLLFENITQTIKSINPTQASQDSQKIQELNIRIDESFDKIKNSLENESELLVSFEKSQIKVKNALLLFEETLIEKQKIIESRQGELIFKDSDTDEISDYDEIYVYKTNPENRQTKGKNKTDGQKIKEGINPLSEGEEKIAYQNPREDIKSFVTDSYQLNKVQLVNEGGKKMFFEGIALPNSHITLYIYSTPIVTTVKTDENGIWRYELTKELENGEHQIYIATVNTSGKIIARSNPILFTKTTEAATIGIAGNINNSTSTQNFLKDNFILIILSILIIIVISSMMFFGNHKNIRSAILELKKEVKNKK